jgi:hypothetical protein
MIGFGKAFVDVDEQRDTPAPHRYLHGGFDGNDTRFSLYLPPPNIYQDRFLHLIEGGLGGNECAARDEIEFAFECGAYLVESNQGHVGDDLSGSGGDVRVHAYEASVASARFAREIAADTYGAAPHHGYLYGGSGGGHRTILCLENGGDTWDGAVPFVVGPHPAYWLSMSVVARALLALGVRTSEVIDAMEPGGAGDPFVAGLTTQQREALADLYRAGFPRGAEVEISGATKGMWAYFAPEITSFDPGYFEQDFWSLPGYAGADRPEEVEACLIDEHAAITRVYADGGKVTAIGIERADMDALVGARITVLSGRERGLERYVVATSGDRIDSIAVAPDLWGRVAAGDEIRIDNRQFVAFSYWHRHQLGEPYDRVKPRRLDVDELRHLTLDGLPIFPQRALFRNASLHGLDTQGKFDGKMIVVQNLLDPGAWPFDIVHYEQLVRARYGDGADDRLRVWWTENAAHGPPPPALEWRLIDFGGIVEQAVQDVIDWVERGVQPPRSSAYCYSADHRLTLAPEAGNRFGVQPLAIATANGDAHAIVHPGEDVTFEVTVECPPHGGTVVAVEWYFEASSGWSFSHAQVDGTQTRLRLSTTHCYSSTGTYFPAARVVAHRDGDMDASTRRLVNLARVRVTVTE